MHTNNPADKQRAPLAMTSRPRPRGELALTYILIPSHIFMVNIRRSHHRDQHSIRLKQGPAALATSPRPLLRYPQRSTGFVDNIFGVFLR
jgi:hypothetical protein